MIQVECCLPPIHIRGKNLKPASKNNRSLKRNGVFNAQAFLNSAGIAKKNVSYRRGDVIFTQGDLCDHVLYIQKGNVKLSVLSKSGREAVVAKLGAGEFFGEGCLAGQPVRMGSATATADSSVLLVDKNQMV